MPYTVQIDVSDVAPLDGVTPIDFSNPGVSVVQSDDRFVVTLDAGIAFGSFDPGELVALPTAPFLLLSATIVAPAIPFVGGTGAIRVDGPLAPGGDPANRKSLDVLAPLVQGLAVPIAQLLPFDHCISFVTDPGDPGPYRIVLTVEPFRDSRQPNGEDLPSAWAAGSLAS